MRQTGSYTGNGGGLTNLNYSNITNQPVIPSTNGFVTASITNGFVTAAITNGLASISYVNTATNGFVTASITNGLATMGYVTRPMVCY